MCWAYLENHPSREVVLSKLQEEENQEVMWSDARDSAFFMAGWVLFLDWQMNIFSYFSKQISHLPMDHKYLFSLGLIIRIITFVVLVSLAVYARDV